ncbi:MAG TPA: hypothetical protein VK936_10335 [Longimicrobiales bacterium]|nr:hypothetical protein [Longimicrobiales bacterium]
MSKDRPQDEAKQSTGTAPAKPAEQRREPPETARHPAPHIRHAPEPSAENIMPAEDEPGTL